MNGRYFERMRAQLGADFAAYEACLSAPPVRGVRANTLKLSAEEFRSLSPFALTPVAWEPSGFFVEEE